MRGVVSVKYTNPESDKGGASLKDEAGTYWYLPQDMPLDQFQPGTNYDVVYSQATSKAGRTYNKIIELLAVNVPGGASTAPPAASAPQSHQAAPQAVNRPVQAQDQRKDMLIFVTGVVGRSMGSGDFTPDHISALTKAAKEAYLEFLA